MTVPTVPNPDEPVAEPDADAVEVTGADDQPEGDVPDAGIEDDTSDEPELGGDHGPDDDA